MQRFENMLLVTQEVRQESSALKHALMLMESQGAKLSIVIFQPEVPDELKAYQAAYDKALVDTMQAEIDGLCAKDFCPDYATIGERISIDICHEQPFAIEAVRRVLQRDHDALLKDVEPVDSGLHANDMNLLRKCPCPVWLCRPDHSDAMGGLTLAVAIDPLSPEKAGNDLAVELIRQGAAMSRRLKAELNLLSCWEWKWERAVRNSAFVSLPDDELEEQVNQARDRHRQSLEKLVEEAGIDYPYTIEIKKGKADAMIPAMVKAMEVDILLMGTVARTGIPGFLIGNTAENIAHHIACSLFAVKPHGFVSPVEAYK